MPGRTLYYDEVVPGREIERRLGQAGAPVRTIVGQTFRSAESAQPEGLAHVGGSNRYFASGSGRTWKCSTLLVVPFPVSMWNGARVLTVA